VTNLKRLYVRHSTHMDRNLTHITNQVMFNLLTSLPSEIGQLTRLEVLKVRAHSNGVGRGA
jgi:hypothetical protein